MITLLQPKPGGWLLMVGPPSKNSTVISAIVQLTNKGPLRVLDCADYFPRQISVQTRAHRNRPEEEQVTIAQATTCQEVLDALRNMQTVPIEFVVLDMLRPFCRKKAETEERKKVLKACIKQLDRLAKKASGIVMVSPPVVPTSATLELLGLLNASSSVRSSAAPYRATQNFRSSTGEDHSFWDLPIL